MKHVTQSSLIAVALALLGAAAHADDQQHTQLLALQNAAIAASAQAATVAVYTGHSSIGAQAAQDPHAATYELRPNGHGQAIGMYRATAE